MTSLHRSMPDAAWAPLDSEHFVPASTALEKDSKETLNSALHQLRLPPITDSSVACLSTPEGSRERRRCSAAHKPCTGVHLFATPDHTGSRKCGPAPEADPTSKTSVSAGEPAAAPLAQERGGQALQLEECAPTPKLHGLTSALTHGSRLQQTSSRDKTSPKSTTSPSASLLSPAAVNGSSEPDSEKPPFLKKNEDLPAPCAALATPRLEEHPQEPEEATHFSAADVQPSTPGSDGRLSRTIVPTASEVGIKKISDYLEKGSSSSDFCPGVRSQEATPRRVLLRNSGATECCPTIQHRARLQLQPEISSNHVLSQPQLSGVQQASLPPPSRETALDPESGLQLQHQHAELLHQSGGPQVFVEQLHSPECDASISAQERTSSARVTTKESYFNTQHAACSATPQFPTTWPPVSPDLAHPARYSLFVADGCETSDRSLAQPATARLLAEGSVTSLPCWSPSACPLCPSLGLPSMAIPPHSLQQLHPQLQDHLLSNWQATYSLPSVYFHSDHNETETVNYSTAYGTGASAAPLWADGVDGPKGSYSPGGLWQPLPSAYVKRGLQTSLQAGETFSCGHVTEDRSNNCTSCSRCRTQQWTPRMQSEQGHDSFLTFSQAATRWLQQAQQEITQRLQAEQFQHYDVCGNASGLAPREALMSSANSFHMEGGDAQVDWNTRDYHVETDSKKKTSTKGGGSSVYRRQLLQQLAVRHSEQQTRQAENVSPLVANEKVDATEMRKKEEDPPKEQAPIIPHGLCTLGEAGMNENCGNGTSASPEVDAVSEANDSLHTCVTAAADPNLLLVAATEARESPPAEGGVNHSPQDSYDGFSATYVPGDEGCATGCIDPSSTQQFVHADDLCSLGQHMQWVVPPPEAAAALAAVRAAAASAAAAIAAEWQQHLEQHYLEDWMHQLSPAHQWWLLHLQQTDQPPIRYMPFYMKDWQETEEDANVGMSAVLDAEARRIAASATAQTTQEQREVLQSAGEEGEWKTVFNEQHPWQLQTSTLEDVMHPASPPWTAGPPGPPTSAAGMQQGTEGGCWENAAESSLLREQQTVPYLRNASRQHIDSLHRCARTDRCDQGSNTLRELIQRWESDANFPGVVASSESMLSFLSQRPRQHRQLLRVAPRSTERLSLSEQADGMQLRANGQRSMLNRSGRRWRRAQRGQLGEDCCRGLQTYRRPDVCCSFRRPCCPTCCADLVTSSCSRCVFHASANDCTRRTAGDCTAAVGFLYSSEIEEPCRLQGARGHEENLFGNASRWGKEAEDLDVRAPLGMALVDGSVIKETEFRLHLSGKRLITRSCCFPYTRSIMQKNGRRRGASHESVPQKDTTVAAKEGSSSAVKSEHVIHKRYALLGGESLDCKDALKTRQTEQGVEGVSKGTELRTTDVLPTRCTSRKAGTAVLRDKTPAHSNIRVSLSRPPATCAYGENCVHGWVKKNAPDATGSTLILDRRTRCSERFRDAGQNLSSWGSGGKCSTCQAGRSTASCKNIFGSVTQSSGHTTNVASVCGKTCRTEKEPHTDLTADDRTAPEKWPLPRRREGTAVERNFCAPPRSRSRAQVRSVSTIASTKKTNDTGEGRTRRVDRPC